MTGAPSSGSVVDFTHRAFVFQEFLDHFNQLFFLIWVQAEDRETSDQLYNHHMTAKLGLTNNTVNIYTHTNSKKKLPFHTLVTHPQVWV